jgi:hypothetical protein
MMEIKTIYKQMDLRREFDEEVNAALAAGWTLTRRDVLDGRPLPDNVFMHRGLYAELVKPDPPKAQPEPDLMAAVRMINKLCLQFGACRHCPLDDICEHRPPNFWDPPEEVQP